MKATLHNPKVYVLSLLSLFVCATSKTNAKSQEEGLYPHTISISTSEAKYKVEMPDGYSIDLPKIEKQIIPQKWEITPPAIAQIDDLTAIKDIKEMKNLSQTLGITIKDNKNINLYREAAKWLGTRYRWAGKTEKGVDCSGLTGIIIKSVYHKDIDRSSSLIATKIREERNVEELQPGDLVFFATRKRGAISHVGIYLGDKQFIHAARSGVKVDCLDDSYYARTFRKAGKI